MRTSKILLTTALLMLTMVCGIAQVIPQKISYQGKLLENGQPVNGTKSITFTIDTWSETHSVNVIDGLYSVTLGSQTPIPETIFINNNNAVLQITVEGNALSPTTEILSSPYAFKASQAALASDAQLLNGQSGSYYQNWNNLQNVPPGFADGTDDGGSIPFEAVVAEDGSGDYTTIQNAITAGKKSIFVKHGTYTLTSDLSLPDNAIIQGENWQETIITGNAKITGVNKVTLKNLKITCSSSPAISFTGDYNTFENLWIETATTMGISGYGANNRILNCHIVCNAYPIGLGQYAIVRGNYLDGGSATECDLGSYCILSSNQVRKSGNVGTSAVYANTFCVIENNIIISTVSSNTGIYAKEGCSVIGNYIEQFSTGIFLSYGQAGSTCTGNNVKNCSGNAYHVSTVNNAGWGPTIISGNTAYSPGDRGFYLDGPKIFCHNNTVYSAGTDGFYGWNTWQVVISNNYAESCTQNGFNFGDNLDRSTFTGNLAFQNSGAGFIVYAIDCVINSNNAFGNNNYGFQWLSANACTIVGNVAQGNSPSNWDVNPNTISNEVGLNRKD